MAANRMPKWDGFKRRKGKDPNSIEAWMGSKKFGAKMFKKSTDGHKPKMPKYKGKK